MTTKTARIVELAKADPTLPNRDIARITGASELFISTIRNRHGCPYQGPPTVSDLGRMSCEECGSPEIACVDSRPTTFRGHASIRRRRKCRGCGYLWTTYEIQEEWAEPTATRDEVIRQLEMLIASMRASE